MKKILFLLAIILSASYSFSQTNFFSNVYKSPPLAPVRSLDLSFGDDGIVTTSFDARAHWGYTVAIQDDGKILVAGHVMYNNYNGDIALSRYNTNGNQ